jgi:hypothetical protein
LERIENQAKVRDFYETTRSMDVAHTPYLKVGQLVLAQEQIALREQEWTLREIHAQAEERAISFI